MLISRSTFGMAVVAALVAAGSAWAEDLTGRVAASLRDSGALAGYRVNVKAKDGTVWLSGTVNAAEQIGTAVGIAENTPGVERVVNQLTVARDGASVTGAGGLPDVLSLPSSIRSLAGLGAEPAAVVGEDGGQVTLAGASGDAEPTVQLVAGSSASKPAASNKKKASKTMAKATPVGSRPAAPRQKAAATPRPLNSTSARPIPLRGQGVRNPARQAIRTSAEGEPMMLPTPADYGAEGLVDGQMVPGSMRISEGNAVEGQVVGGGGMGRPMPMGGVGVGMPPVPVRGDGPNMPNYAWPSYAASPNYAALQYPTQYSPTAWPYIGPFYPYPQVPLGWRRVSLEWDDGWWFLDFDDRHHHTHHR